MENFTIKETQLIYGLFKKKLPDCLCTGDTRSYGIVVLNGEPVYTSDDQKMLDGYAECLKNQGNSDVFITIGTIKVEKSTQCYRGFTGTKIPKYSVITEDACIGCGACESICEAVFTCNDEVEVNTKAIAENLDLVRDCIDACPVGILKLREE